MLILRAVELQIRPNGACYLWELMRSRIPNLWPPTRCLSPPFEGMVAAARDFEAVLLIA